MSVVNKYCAYISDREGNILTRLDRLSDRRVNKSLNGIGTAQFGGLLTDEKINKKNIKLGNIVRMYRNGSEIFIGEINNIQANTEKLIVNCRELTGRLETRLTSRSFSSTSIGTAIETLLDDTNTIQNTGLDYGGCTVSASIDMEFHRETIWQAIRRMALSAGGEIQMNNEYELSLLDQIGEDKSDSLMFKFIVERPNETNVTAIESTASMDEIINKVYGNANAFASIKEDATSQSTFGLRERSVNFSDAVSQAQTDNLTQNYLSMHKELFELPTLTPDTTKIDYESYEIGDTVRVIFRKGYIDLDENYRILATSLQVDDNGQEKVRVTIADTDRSKLGLRQALDQINERLSLLERN